MKYQKDNFIKLSFQIWLDRFILNKGEAFTTGIYPLYYIEDENLPNGYLSYSSPFKQWVWDSSINNVQIPTEVILNNSGISIDNSDYIADYDNGRIIIKTDNKNLNLEATFSYKDFNIYLTSQSEEDLIMDEKFQENPRNIINESGIKPYNPTTPAIFLNFRQRSDKAFSIGGIDTVTHYVTATIISDNEFQLDAVCSILSDSKNLYVPIINSVINVGSGACYPFGGNWSTDIGGFDYNNRILQKMGKGEIESFYINDVNVYSISPKTREELNLSQYIKFADFELNVIYNPRE